MSMDARRASIVGLAIAAAWAAAIAPARGADLAVRISFEQQFDRTAPVEKMTSVIHDIEAVITERGEVRTTSEKIHAGRRHNHVSASESDRALGSEEHSHWRVVDQNKLIYISDFLTFKRAIELTVREGSCTAQADYELKPGFTEYRYRRRKQGDVVTARSVAATDLTCAVSQAADQPATK